jgi:hypothetical protein
VIERNCGVYYLLVDRVHGPVNPRLADLAQAVFSNASATVYRLP